MRCALPLWPRLAALAVVLLGLAAPAQAHDTWIMPAAFRVPVGHVITTVISAGHGLVPLSAPRRRRLRALHLIDNRGRHDPERWRRGGKSSRAQFAASAPGVACLALSTEEAEIHIEPESVDAYLCEVQAPLTIIEAWRQQRERAEPWVERYAKDAKTYLRSGPDSAAWPELAQLGHALELVPQSDPTCWVTGDTITLVLQAGSAPVADVALRLFNGAGHEVVVRTDFQGRAQFRLQSAGPHLVATTLIQRPEKQGAPWTSRFATLGFGVDGA